ncbi:MAG: GxxExxY protein [Bacteroidetes bacterium]|nr:GxxExxY protein [Bacteroidota bacterium]
MIKSGFRNEIQSEELNNLAKIIVDSCYEVHRNIGPGLLESVYENCLEIELKHRGIKTDRQVPVPLKYKNVDLEKEFYIDLLVEDKIVIEIKAVETMIPVFEAQLLSYLKLADKRLGFLVNFNVPLIKYGIRRFVNGLEK